MGLCAISYIIANAFALSGRFVAARDMKKFV